MNLFRRTIDAARADIEHIFESEINNFSRCRLLGIWRSPLEREIRQRGPKHATVWEWKHFIGNLPCSGVSQDEIDISGVMRWLEREQDQVQLVFEEILDYLDEVGLKIHVMQERGWTLARPWFFIDDPEHPTRFQSSLSNDKLHNSRIGIQVEPAGLFDPERARGRWVVRFRHPETDEVQLLLDAPDPATAVEYAHGVAWRHMNAGIGRYGRFSRETLSGGTNYREILFVIPNAYPAVRNFHFPVQNVFCHLRLVDRMNNDGARLLHIEEIQSDWHYPHIRNLDPPMKGQWMKIALSWCVQEALERNLAGVSISSGDIQVNRNGETRAPGLRNFYRHAEKTLQTIVSKIGGKSVTAVYHCHEQKYRVDPERGGWAIIDRCGHQILQGIPTREAAEKIHRNWLPDGPIEVPAFRFQTTDALTWQRPFYRLDPDSPATQRAKPAITDRGRDVLALLDEIDSEIFEAALSVSYQYFGALKDCMREIQYKLQDQELLPDEIADVFRAYSDEAVRIKICDCDHRLISDELSWLRKTTHALRDHIRENGDLPEEWWAVCPQRARLQELLQEKADSQKPAPAGQAQENSV